MKKIALSLIISLWCTTVAFPQVTANRDVYAGIEFPMSKVQEPVFPKNSVSIADFGAKNGGQELCTKSFADAIETLSRKGGGRLIIPRGTWLTGPIILKSNIEIHAESGALVIFSNNKDL